jgi:hypothetical protein
MRIPKLAVAATAGLAALAAPAAASAAAPAPPVTMPPLALTFVPPRVGPLSVDIGVTVINGKVISPGVHVLMPGASVPPLASTPTHLATGAN